MLECFAYNDIKNGCMCLDKLYCNKDFGTCKFYKTRQQYAEGLKKYPNRSYEMHTEAK